MIVLVKARVGSLYAFFYCLGFNPIPLENHSIILMLVLNISSSDSLKTLESFNNLCCRIASFLACMTFSCKICVFSS